MGVDVIGAADAATAIYGAEDATGYTVAAPGSQDTTASVTFTTLLPNTKWLVEIDADISFAGISGPAQARLRAKVDGSYRNTTGQFVPSRFTDVGWLVVDTSIRGRTVVTLASTGSHTVLANMQNAGGNGLALGNVTLTATQLTG